MENAEKYGIEKVEKLLVALAKAGNEVAGATEDKKFTFVEGLGLIDNAGEVFANASNLGALGQELSDLSDKEKKQLAETFAKEFDIAHDKAERKVEATLTMALGIVAYINEMRA